MVDKEELRRVYQKGSQKEFTLETELNLAQFTEFRQRISKDFNKKEIITTKSIAEWRNSLIVAHRRGIATDEATLQMIIDMGLNKRWLSKSKKKFSLDFFNENLVPIL